MSRSDVYSLAVVVYEMLAGEPPFKGDLQTVIRSHIEVPPPALAKRRPDAPALVSQLLEAAMSKRPEHRPGCMAAFAGALRVRAEGAGVVLRQAFALYSERFPLFFGISVFASVPAFVAALALLAAIPFLGIKSPLLFLFAAPLMLAIYLAFGVNRAGFAIAVENLRAAPFDEFSWRKVIAELKRRTGVSARLAPLRSYLSLYARLAKLSFSFRVGLGRIFGVTAAIIERCDVKSASARSEELASRLPHVLQRIVALLPALLLSAALFFFSAFGVGKAFGLDTLAAVNLSWFVALAVFAINYVWLITPLTSSVTLLYFRARQAGGETIDDFQSS